MISASHGIAISLGFLCFCMHCLIAIIMQVLSVFALIPMLVVGWREVLHVVGYSTVMLIFLNHVRNLCSTSELTQITTRPCLFL